MPSNRSSDGDPARTLELLWRQPSEAPRRGPRPGSSVDAVVVAATGIADAEGLEAVTMRRVSQDLHLTPMAVYTYVPGKAELIELMLDTAYTEMVRTETAGQPWQHRLRAVALENQALLVAHPWIATVATTRPPLGPGVMAKYEHELRAFEDCGLDDVATDAALTFLLGFVHTCERGAADARATARQSAMNDTQWWATNAPLLARVFDERTYPTAARIGTAAGAAQGGAYNAAHAFTFGLERVINGLAALIDNNETSRRPPMVGRTLG